MADIRFHVPAQCFVGQDTIYKLPFVFKDEYQRAMLIADPAVSASGTRERFTGILEEKGLNLITFDDIEDRPSSAAVEEAVNLARGARVECIIGLGGVRVLHIAKAAAALAGSGSNGSVDAWMDGTPPTRNPLPLALVPTTYRDPFLLSGGLILSDARTGNAVFLQAKRGIETALFLDPNALGGLSAKTTAAVFLDGMMAAIEGLTSARDDVLSDLLLKEAVAHYIRALDVSIKNPDDPQARFDAVRACFLTGLGLASAAPGLGTALSFAIHTRWEIPKSNLAAVILPYLLELLANSRPEKIAALAPFLCDMENPLAEVSSQPLVRAAEALRTRLGLLKIPSRLKDFDIPIERLIECAEVARRFDFMNFLPRAMTADDVFDFIKMIY